jgi:superkiller protein 3
VPRYLVALSVLAAAAAAGAGMYTVYATDREYSRQIENGDRAVAAEQPFQALEAYSGAIAMRPDSMLAHLKRGIIYRERGELDEAMRDLRRAAELDPTATQPQELLADLHLARQRYDRAAERYEAFLALDNRSPRVWYKLGLSRYRSGETAAAVIALRRAVALDRAAAEAHLLLGLALRDHGQPEESRNALETAAQLAPSLTAARDALAAMYAGPQPDRSIDQLEALAALDASRPERAVALGLAHARHRRYETAVIVLSRAVERFPADPLVYAALGRVWLEMAQARDDAIALKKAVEALRTAASQSEATSEALTDLGRALLRSGDPAAAERALLRAVARYPVTADAYRLLGGIAARSGRLQEARDALVQYATLAGAGQSVADAALQIADYSLRIGDVPAATRWLARAEGMDASPRAVEALQRRLPVAR